MRRPADRRVRTGTDAPATLRRRSARQTTPASDSTADTCAACGVGRYKESRDVALVSSNARCFHTEHFTVWRCPTCASLNSLEPIDYDRYYDDYFMQRQPLDFFARRLFAQRLHDLHLSRVARDSRILDHGCGNGNFVRFLHERGFAGARGYDPYSPDFADRAALASRYDMVTSQDVVEHAPDPGRYLDDVAGLVRRPGGVLAIGTPNAEHIDLADPIDQVGPLHQPFHRHILTGDRLVAMLMARRFRIDRVVTRSYVDTWFPFVNSAFLFNYMAAVDGTVESGFDPIHARLILGSPKLMFHGFFGRLEHRRKDILVIATAR